MSVDIIGTYAPKEATYLVQTASGSLTNEQALSSLVTGVMKVTNGTGVISTAAAGTDYVAPGGALGTPSSGTLTNCSGLPVSTGISGLGTNVATALAINVGTSGAVAVLDGAIGTPSSGTLTNCSGLPITGLVGDAVTALAVGSIELGHASDTTITRTGAGAIAVEGVAVILSGGALGTPASGTLTNCTGLPLTGITGDAVTALAVGSIELGHASDTTITRTGAGAIAVEGVGVLLSGGALGTPASGTLTNCSGLPLTGLVSDTTTAVGVGTIELGHASDTTIARVSAGVISVEGVTIPSASSTTTFTNKRVTPRVGSTASSATPTINTDDYDAYSITALAAAITSFTTNLSGTPTNFQKLIIRIKDDGTARAIAWGASFEAKGVDLPITTVASKVLTVGFIYDTVTSKWGCVASAQEA